MKKLAVEERRLPVTDLLNSCEESCPILKEVNKKMAEEVVLYKVDEISLLADAFAKHIKHVGGVISLLRKNIT